jgi:hypothetical protein
MQRIEISADDDTPQWMIIKLEFVKSKIELHFRVSNDIDPKEDIKPKEDIDPKEEVKIEVPIVVESKEDMKVSNRKDSKRAYYLANRVTLLEKAKAKRKAKKQLKKIAELLEVEQPVSLESAESVDIDGMICEVEKDFATHMESLSDIVANSQEERHSRYIEKGKPELLYYYENKEKIQKRQSTDEYRARCRELYHQRRAAMSEEENEARRRDAKAERRMRNFILKVNYPGCKTLKAAKAADKLVKQMQREAK